jgi:hypothetical protein
MRRERILDLLKQKESGKLEFKEARRKVPSSLFETVCSFLNRDGGDIFPGVHDSGEISPGRQASFMEDVIFTTTIPIPKLDDLKMGDLNKTTPQVTPQVTPQDTPQVTPQVIKLLKVCQGEMSRGEIQSKLDLEDREYLRKAYLKPALKIGFIELTIPDKPNSKNQKYRITGKGKIFLKTGIKQRE